MDHIPLVSKKQRFAFHRISDSPLPNADARTTKNTIQGPVVQRVYNAIFKG